MKIGDKVRFIYESGGGPLMVIILFHGLQSTFVTLVSVVAGKKIEAQRE